MRDLTNHLPGWITSVPCFYRMPCLEVSPPFLPNAQHAESRTFETPKPENPTGCQLNIHIKRQDPNPLLETNQDEYSPSIKDQPVLSATVLIFPPANHQTAPILISPSDFEPRTVHLNEDSARECRATWKSCKCRSTNCSWRIMTYSRRMDSVLMRSLASTSKLRG